MKYIEDLYSGDLYPAENIPETKEYAPTVREYVQKYNSFVIERESSILSADEAVKARIQPMEEELNLRSFKKGFQNGARLAAAGECLEADQERTAEKFRTYYQTLMKEILTEMDFKSCLEALEERKRMGLPEELLQMKKRLVEMECESKYLQGLDLGYGLVKEGLA